MLKKIINRIKVSNLKNFNEAFNFTNSLVPNVDKNEFKKSFTEIQLKDFDLTIGSAKEKIDKLREELKKTNTDAILVSTNDEYLNEYVPLYANRLFFITGFNGSYGFSLITQTNAVLFVDGRYTEQAKQQVDDSIFKIHSLSFSNITNWIKANIKDHQTVKIDAKSTSYALANYFIKNLSETKIKLTFSDDNLIDAIWTKQPLKPLSPISKYELEYAGEESLSKINKILEFMKQKNLDFYVVTALDNIAWLLNIRGQDIECNPLILCSLVIHKDGILHFFVDKLKITNVINNYFNILNVIIYEENKLSDFLISIINKNIGIVINSPYYYYQTLNKQNKILLLDDDLIQNLKCIKNKIEQKNAFLAHLKDGVALTKLIIWLNKYIQINNISEIEIANKLNDIKSKVDGFKGPSFHSIVAVNSNAAYPHYKATTDNITLLNKDSNLLIDSGGQYLEGTTDVTRTLSYNYITDEFKHAFTLVLKGFIALSKIHFPKGCSGSNLDALARQFLWEESEDYNHGTGHGVGQYLNVHEGPINFSRKNTTELKEGMIISIEPGLYKINKFGIRIENLVLITQSSKNENFLEFKPLTLAPIDIKNIDSSLLSNSEKEWLNNYHVDIFNSLFSYLNAEEKEDLRILTDKI